jgi:hypothetical protein
MTTPCGVPLLAADALRYPARRISPRACSRTHGAWLDHHARTASGRAVLDGGPVEQTIIFGMLITFGAYLITFGRLTRRPRASSRARS